LHITYETLRFEPTIDSTEGNFIDPN
jgi:hypothetical protein